VTQVLSGDRIVLDSGQTVKLVGVECAAPGDKTAGAQLARKHGAPVAKVVEYAGLARRHVSGMATCDHVKVNVDPVRVGEDGVITGYVWTVDYRTVRASLQAVMVIPYPVYSCLNETALSCGWVFTDDAAPHPMKEKHRMLQEMARRGRVGVWEPDADAGSTREPADDR
jgi:hypothetical protein